MEEKVAMTWSRYANLLEELKTMFEDLERVVKENAYLKERVRMLEEQIVQLGGEVIDDELAVTVKGVRGTPLTEVPEMSLISFNAVYYRARIRTLDQLASYKASELLGISGFGPVSLNEIVIILSNRGLELTKEVNAREQKRIDKILLPSRMKTMKVEKLGLSEKALEWMHRLELETVYDMRQYDAEGRGLRVTIRDDKVFKNIVSCLENHGFSYPFAS